MLKNVRSILHSTMLIVIGLPLILALVGCENMFEPKKDFLGIEKNLTQWLLYAAQPSNPNVMHEMSPGQYFQDYLEGSRVYHFEAHFPDNTSFGAFDMRINNVSGDARINDVNIDWYVAWGIGAVACVTPVGGGDASNYSLTLENFTTQVGKTKSTLGMTPPAPMTLTMVSPSELSSFRKTVEDPSLSKLYKVRAFNTLRVRHHLTPIMEDK